MGEETTSLGGIHISPNAVAAIVYHATLQSYGVVGLAPKNLVEGLIASLQERGYSDLEEMEIKEEDVRFNLPAELVRVQSQTSARI